MNRGDFPRPALTDEQWDVTTSLDDAIQHCHFEIDPDQYRGVSTCGFASIADVDGRRKFMRRIKSNAEEDRHHYQGTRNGVSIEIGGWRITVHEDSYRGGYRVSISDQTILHGPDIQRLDFQERLHREFLRRMQQNGYLEEARVTSRID